MAIIMGQKLWLLTGGSLIILTFIFIFFLGPVKTLGTDPSHLSWVNFLGQVMIC